MRIQMVTGIFLALMATTAMKGQTVGGAVTQGAIPQSTAYHVVETGANHRVWQRETYELAPDGSYKPHIHQYTELASGMNYKNDQGQWVPSQEIIEPYTGGAIARQGQYQVIFANNLNSSGAIEVQATDGKRLRSSILGLAYYDSSTGKSVLLAQVKDSQGELISDNQVLYPNAFDSMQADVRYTYRRGSFEQDVILHEQPPSPQSLGLNPDTTELEAITEFIDPPAAQVTTDALTADQLISWGGMEIGRGKAFELGDSSTDRAKTFVRKQYGTINGRHILLENVKIKDVRNALSRLPLQSRLESRLPVLASKELVLPKERPVRMAVRPMRMAQEVPQNKGFVLDYVIVSSVLNYTLKADTTYYVTGWYYLEGLTTIEGGTVIKFTNSPAANPALDFYGNWVTKAGPYRPVVFTSKDDNSVGEVISGSTGNPTILTNAFYFVMDGFTNYSVSNLRISYAQYGLVPDYGGPVDVRDCQFFDCLDPIQNWIGVNIYLHNVLFAASPAAVAIDAGNNCSLIGENVTADVDNLLDTNYAPIASICLTNSIVFTTPSGLAAATVQTNCTAINPTGTVFQRVGAGSYYLTPSSPYRDAGTTNISIEAFDDITTRTTYPPQVYSNLTLSGSVTFGQQAPRDTNTPDLGYHYDPLDYAFSGVKAYSNVTFTAGTAAGWFELPNSGGAGYGISIYDKVLLSFNGTASDPCTLARYSTVQEGGDGLWTTRGWLAAITAQSLSGGYSMNPTNAGLIMPNFTRHCVLAADPNQYREYNALIKILARNSEFYGGGIGAYWDELSATNCLFNRVNLGVGGSNPALYWLRTCTLIGGSVSLQEYGQTWPVWIEDCAFDGTTLSIDNNSGGNTNETYCDFNAFSTNGNSISAPGTHNVIVTNFNWQTSQQGYFYVSTSSPLVDAGSTPSGQFGLYHFTTQTNQIPESGSVVDIGYHYIALDSGGNPLDSNGDGVPDYQEDSNGDGVVDNGENPWAPKPTIVEQPSSQYAIIGSNVLLSVTASSLAPIRYQWYFNTNQISGATNAVLYLVGVQLTNAGSYYASLDNGAGLVVSSNASLTVLTWTNDSDYDGRSDAQEILDGTDPFNPGSVAPFELAQWSFMDTNSWKGDGGQIPLQVTNIVGLPSDISNAVVIDFTNPAILCYRTIETNGNANINLRNGSIHLIFEANWNSVNEGGAGPGDSARLVDVGSYNPIPSSRKGDPTFTNDWWALYFSPDGNQLMFASATNGACGTNLVATTYIQSNVWYDIILTYTPTNSTIYFWNQLVASGGGVVYYPDPNSRAKGFRIGSDVNGNNQINGQFEFLSSYNVALSEDEITNSQSFVVAKAGGVWGGPNICFPNTMLTMGNYPYVEIQYSVPEPGLEREEMSVISGVYSHDGSYNEYLIWGQLCNLTRLIGTFPLRATCSETWQVTSPFDPQDGVTDGSLYGLGATDSSFTFSTPLNGDMAATVYPLSEAVNPVYNILQYFPVYLNGNAVAEVSFPLSVLPAERLLYLSFNDSESVGDGGQLPVAQSNVSKAASPFGQGVNFNADNIDLQYAGFQNDAFFFNGISSSGTPNIRMNEGTIRFWFSPNWTSGHGPNGEAVMFQMLNGNPSVFWQLAAINNGADLQLLNGETCPINFVAGKWYQITVTYSSAQTAIYVNGVLSGTVGPGVTPYGTYGFSNLKRIRIGSDGANEPAQGIIDEVETFNYVKSSAEVQSDYQAAASIDIDGDGISDITEFENGTDLSDPPGGIDPSKTAPTGTDSGAPVIQVTEPSNSN